MARYIYDHEAGKLVEVPTDLPRPKRLTPYIQSDLPAYQSPLGNWMVDGRTARREEMARHQVREVDPSERPVFDKSAVPQHVKDWRAGVGIHRDTPDFAKK